MSPTKRKFDKTPHVSTVQPKPLPKPKPKHELHIIPWFKTLDEAKDYVAVHCEFKTFQEFNLKASALYGRSTEIYASGDASKVDWVSLRISRADENQSTTGDHA